MPKTTKVPQRVYLCLACQDIPEPGQRVSSKFVQQIWGGFKSVLPLHSGTVKPAARRLRNWKWNSFLGWYTCVRSPDHDSWTAPCRSLRDEPHGTSPFAGLSEGCVYGLGARDTIRQLHQCEQGDKMMPQHVITNCSSIFQPKTAPE